MQIKKLLSIYLALLAIIAWPLGAQAGSAGAVQLTPGFTPTYRFASLPFTTATSATDIAALFGSSTKTVYVLNVWITQSGALTAGQNYWYLIKRSSATSGGTSSTLTGVPMDSNNAAATSSASTYTANPTVGSSVGVVASAGISTSAATTSTSGLTVQIYHADNFAQAITLRGVAQCLAVNNNGITNPIAASTSVTFELSEQ